MPRLADLIARNLHISKTEVRRMLAEDLVTDAAGAPLRDPRLEVGTLPYPVLMENEPLALYDQAHLLLNKPAGYVTALRDDHHPTALSLLEGAPLFAELRAVGRLDQDTTGLLLWTTDGQWLQRLTHPKRAVPRTYQAQLARPHLPLPPDLVLEDGHRPQVVSLQPLSPQERHPSLLADDRGGPLATITLVGGAYHEVRRIFAALGSHVLALCRVSFGPFTLPSDLPAGAYLPVDPAGPGDPVPP